MPINQPKTTWKDYVFSWPTYIVIGIALASTIDQTQVLKPLLNKFWKEEKPEPEEGENEATV